MNTNRIWVLFGDLNEPSQRVDLSHQAATLATVVTPTAVPGFADVAIGARHVSGPVLLDTTTSHRGQQMVVYAGLRIPPWTLPPPPGWALTPPPVGVTTRLQELDVALTAATDTRRYHWCRRVWVPATPRQLQRIHLPCDGGATLTAHVVAVTTDTTGMPTPPRIHAVSPTPLPEPALRAGGWARHPTTPHHPDVWREVYWLSTCVEVHCEDLFGYSFVSDVTIHNPDAVDATALRLLTADVRDAVVDAVSEHHTPLP